MKKILIFVFLTTLLADPKDPFHSLSFDYYVKKFLPDIEYIFDDNNVIVSTPRFADNPAQVPIMVDARSIYRAKRMFLLADLNPVAPIADIQLDELRAFVSLNIKVEQGTPLRAFVQDENNLWHIGSAIIKSFGGGCSADTLGKDGTYKNEDEIGQSLAVIKPRLDAYRIKWTVKHPMDTGMFVGAQEYFIKETLITNGKQQIGSLKLFSSISQNPNFALETAYKNNDFYHIKMTDSQADIYFAKARAQK